MTGGNSVVRWRTRTSRPRERLLDAHRPEGDTSCMGLQPDEPGEWVLAGRLAAVRVVVHESRGLKAVQGDHVLVARSLDFVVVPFPGLQRGTSCIALLTRSSSQWDRIDGARAVHVRAIRLGAVVDLRLKPGVHREPSRITRDARIVDACRRRLPRITKADEHSRVIVE